MIKLCIRYSRKRNPPSPAQWRITPSAHPPCEPLPASVRRPPLPRRRRAAAVGPHGVAADRGGGGRGRLAVVEHLRGVKIERVAEADRSENLGVGGLLARLYA